MRCIVRDGVTGFVLTIYFALFLPDHARLQLDDESQDIFSKGDLQYEGACLENVTLDCSAITSKEPAAIHMKCPLEMAGGIFLEHCAVVLHKNTTFWGSPYVNEAEIVYPRSQVVFESQSSLTIAVRNCVWTSIFRRWCHLVTTCVRAILPLQLKQDSSNLTVAHAPSCIDCPSDVRFTAGQVTSCSTATKIERQRIDYCVSAYPGCRMQRNRLC